MADEGRADTGPYEAALALRSLCLASATEFLAAAATLKATNDAPRIRYHLALLALEEIGKGEIGVARAIVVSTGEKPSWVERLLDSHEGKLMWAIWSPMVATRADPKDFEEARRLSARLHKRRLASLYVDHTVGQPIVDPRDVVTSEEADDVLAYTQGRLEAAAATRPASDFRSEDLGWFLDITQDPDKMRSLINPSMMAKYDELQGDAGAWIQWAKAKMEADKALEDELLKTELGRLPSPLDEAKPRWRVTSRVRTASHTLRGKPLAYWNDRMGKAIELKMATKDELLVTLHVSDATPLPQLSDASMSWTKLFLAALNVGTAGFFWFELPTQEKRFYEKIEDLENPTMQLKVERPGIGDVLKQGALNDQAMQRTLQCFALLGSLGETAAAPIFGPYLEGLALTSKADLHLSTLSLARGSFLRAVKASAAQFFGWSGQAASLYQSLDDALIQFVPDADSRRQLLAKVDEPELPAGSELQANLEMKLLADLLISIAAERDRPRATALG